MENVPNFDFKTRNVLRKRPNPEHQRKRTFTLGLHEFVELVQGRYQSIAIADSQNRHKLSLSREEVLANAQIVPFIDHHNDRVFYIVNYANI